MLRAVFFFVLASLPICVFGQTKPELATEDKPSDGRASQSPCGPDQIVLTYPQTARQAYITGGIAATFEVKRDGGVRTIRVAGIRAFAPEVRSALKKAQFGPGCRGLTSHVRFSFRLDRSLPLAFPVRVQRISPTEYEIVSPTDLTGSIDVDPDFISEGDNGVLARLQHWLGKCRFW